MADTLRIKSTMPIAVRISEVHPNPERPGDSPVLKQGIIKPGVNESVDAEMFRAWADTVGKDFVASADDVKAGNTDGRMYEMSEDEPDVEYGFEPALKRAVEANSSEASKGSTLKEAGLVKSEDMRTGSADPAPAPVLAAAGPLKIPATTDAAAKTVAK